MSEEWFSLVKFMAVGDGCKIGYLRLGVNKYLQVASFREGTDTRVDKTLREGFASYASELEWLHSREDMLAYLL